MRVLPSKLFHRLIPGISEKSQNSLGTLVVSIYLKHDDHGQSTHPLALTNPSRKGSNQQL